MLKKKSRNLLILLFFMMLSLCTIIICIKENNEYHHMRERAKYVTHSQVNKLQYVMNTLLLKTQSLEMLVVEADGQVEKFDYIAKSLIDNTAIRSLQLAPNGVVSMVYPLEGNEEAFGDLFADTSRATEAIYARDSGLMTLSGPFELYQGGLGVVARRPIYLENTSSQKTFWGFAIIVLDLPEAFYPAELDKFVAEGYSYQLYRIHPNTKEIQVIDESSKNALINPVEMDFPVPNATWTFRVAPTNGWCDITQIIFEALFALVLSALVTLLVKSYYIAHIQKNEMQKLSFTDSLTNLSNRRMLSKTLDNFVKSDVTFALFFLDLNKFKQVNDRYGHSCGDSLLIECARRLSVYCGNKCLAFRNGGDEFSVIVKEETPPVNYKQIQTDIEQLFSAPILVDDTQIQISISIGYSVYPTNSHTPDQLLHDADLNMYTMKKEAASHS
ncbi:MAG: sensor domain-containing diguanylate cyclase [Christensenellaceae bacterium]